MERSCIFLLTGWSVMQSVCWLAVLMKGGNNLPSSLLPLSELPFQLTDLKFVWNNVYCYYLEDELLGTGVRIPFSSVIITMVMAMKSREFETEIVYTEHLCHQTYCALQVHHLHWDGGDGISPDPLRSWTMVNSLVSIERGKRQAQALKFAGAHVELEALWRGIHS